MTIRIFLKIMLTILIMGIELIIIALLDIPTLFCAILGFITGGLIIKFIWIQWKSSYQ